jgi:thiosulfate dehydrogenase (quinone) large subunit
MEQESTSKQYLRDRNFALAHALARVGLGINIAVHGLSRLGDMPGFASETVKMFIHTFLPSQAVLATAYLIPPAESLIGILLMAGLFLGPALIAGLLVMFQLMFGMTLLQQWYVSGLELFYVAFYAALLATSGWDYYSVDGWRRRAKGQG